ncbi:MAG: lantibiotic dehydratase family protein [Myxococcota bacterium]|nr:lantibiotic dehydratase family protein [Myxococcota bacterium]
MHDIGALYCVRLAGIPFEILDDLAAPLLAGHVAEVLAIERELAAATAAAQAALGEMELARSVRARIKRALARGSALPTDAGAAPTFDRYSTVLEQVARARVTMDAHLAAADEAARRALWSHAKTVLPDFLAIESDSAYRELARHTATNPEDNSEVRYTERALARYLQRVAAKNDTISRFGPTVWGRIDPDGLGFELAMKPGIAARSASIERWVVRAVIAAINRDAALRAELCPRVHPNGRLEGAAFVRLDKVDDTPHALTAADLDMLARCDGATPAHQLDLARLEVLAAAGVVIWEVELVAFDHDPLATLRDDLMRWRDGAAKQTWMSCVDALADAARRFASIDEAEPRRALMDHVLTLVEKLGGAPPRGGTLYQASNPIIEECAREGRVVIGGKVLREVVDDIAPWLDLFSDAFALAASRAYRRLCELLETAPRGGAGISLAELIAHGDANGFSLREGGLGMVARATFDEIKRDFAARFASRPDAAEWELTRADCHLLRAKYTLPPAGDHGWACPDLQIAASSPEQVAAGNCTWVVAELHGVMAPLQRAVSWSCPDPQALAAIYSSSEPWLLPSRVAATVASVHVSIETMLSTIPNAVFCAPERPRPHWRYVAPSETEVVAMHDIHDIRVRARRTGEDLGSLVRTQWMAAAGLHPFFPLELVPHTPRLRLGRAIVQRRSWRVVRSELAVSVDHGVTTELVLALARLRAARDLPRWVYVRPAATLLDHSRVLGRSRDAKPMYIDLESTIFLDIFCRHLEKYGALDVVEMLPSPDQLCWREDGGRYSFELRMMTPPRR